MKSTPSRRGFLGDVGTAVAGTLLLGAAEADASPQSVVAANTGGGPAYDFQMIDSFHPNLNATLEQLSSNGYEVKSAFPFSIPDHPSPGVGNGGGFNPNGFYVILQRPRRNPT